MLNRKAYREKEVIDIHRKLNQLYKAHSALGAIPLKKPLRHGWYQHLKLRADISRRKDAMIFQEIIDNIGLSVWGRDKKHAHSNWQYYLQRHNAWLSPGLEKIDKKKLMLLSPKAQRHFSEKCKLYNYGGWGSQLEYHCTAPIFYFEIGYSKAYITHRQILDADLIRRIAELEDALVQPLLYNTAQAYYSYYSSWHKKRRNQVARRKSRHALQSFSLGSISEETFALMLGEADQISKDNWF